MKPWWTYWTSLSETRQFEVTSGAFIFVFLFAMVTVPLPMGPIRPVMRKLQFEMLFKLVAFAAFFWFLHWLYARHGIQLGPLWPLSLLVFYVSFVTVRCPRCGMRLRPIISGALRPLRAKDKLQSRCRNCALVFNEMTDEKH